jgi:ATP-dependent helicase/DNAse subunit B
LAEFKAAHVSPTQLTAALNRLGGEPRLIELARLYAAYQHHLQTHHWTDRAGLGWLALEVVTDQSTLTGSHIFVDGFDNFTPTQLEFLAQLTRYVRRLVITITGQPTEGGRPLAHRRFNQTRQQLEAALGITAQPLPAPAGRTETVLTHLESHLFEPIPSSVTATVEFNMLEAIDRPAEVRAALRWLKARIVHDNLPPAETALLARDISPYRSTIIQVAAEFGLPLRLVDGQPLNHSPVVTALLNLLQVMLPAGHDASEPALPYAAVIDAWRSPFFNWSGPDSDPDSNLGSEAARLLAALARRQKVLGGLNQWHSAFETVAGSESSLETLGLSADDLAALRRKFDHFVQRVIPPRNADSYLAFAGWLEDLIGPDPDLTGRYPQPDRPQPISLRVIERIRAASSAVENLTAIRQLKALLHSLVWAEQVLAPAQTVTYRQFVEELAGLIEASFYILPTDLTLDAIMVADVPQVRGLSFAAVAVLGLAEGDFPAALSEDPLLPEADRRRLIDLGLPLTLALDSAEAEFFYEAVTRARNWLLLSRPRLADNGADWPASPFWEAARRVVTETPQMLAQDSLPSPSEAASWPELWAVSAGWPTVGRWLAEVAPTRQQSLNISLAALAQRRGERGLYNGQIAHMAEQFAADFGLHHTWSASQLESYLVCPFMFFTQRVLAVEARDEPGVGLDARQLGRIYHRLFEETYALNINPANFDDLLAAFETVSAEILDNAPLDEGFQPTAWWQHIRQNIAANVRVSLARFAQEVEDLPPEHRFCLVSHEARFGYDLPFAIEADDDVFYLRGSIDRIDQNAAGEFRIIDYKTGGPSGFPKTALQRNDKLQLPLYALAAREALQMGELADGFYWHVQHAQASDFTLRDFHDDDFGSGPNAAIELAIAKAWTAVRGVRAGRFTPQAPAGGCPPYCPAADFCRHYLPKGW